MHEIAHYFPNLTNKQITQFKRLGEILLDWNKHINLISRKDTEFFYTRHVLHSLAIAKYIGFKSGSKIMDVGTGGGFPGIPLAILFPEVEFFLIDSIEKKIKVVKDVILKLGLNNCIAERVRAEKVKGKFDFVVSRAVAPLPVFYQWIRNNIDKKNKHDFPNGVLFLKGGDLSQELKDFKGKFTETEIASFFEDEFFETKKIIHLNIS